MTIVRPALMGAVFSLSLAASVLTGCKGATVAPVAQLKSAATAGDKLAPIQLDRVVFNFDRGQQIGAYRGGRGYTGCGVTLSPEPIHWQYGRITVQDAEISDVFGQELRRAGYNIVGDPDQLFEDMSAGATEAEYLVGGRVDAVVMDVCDEISVWTERRLDTQSGEISMDVTWQVFSLLERKVVLETKSRGSAKLEEGIRDGEVELLLRGLSAAASNLAADQKFHALLTGSKAEPIAAVSQTATPINLRKTPPFDGLLTANMKRIQASVVTIRSGRGMGSGFFVAPDLVMTNAHVVGTVSRHKILLSNGAEVYAKTLRSDVVRDVALLQVESGTYPPLPLRNEKPGLAEEVYAVGSPLDESLAGTITKGIVSQFNQDENGQDMIQADVTIQHGSSGGPLLDAQGAVIGLSRSGLTDATDHSIGINFFIPIGAALKSLNLVVS